jgi:xanthine dehydrogenase small subunit
MGGARELPLEDFYLDYMKKDLQPGEFVRSVHVPRARPGLQVRSYKISKRYDQDISALCGAFAIRIEHQRVAAARVAFGGMAATPRRAPACERALAGAVWSEDGIAPAIAALASDFAPITDFRAARGYRAAVAGNLLRRLLAETRQRGATASVWSHAG